MTWSFLGICLRHRVVFSKLLLAFFSVFLINSLVINDFVSAEDPLPHCTSAEVHGNGIANTIQVILNCSDIDVFVSSGELTANATDLDKFRLVTDGVYRAPTFAVISENTITLNYLNGQQSGDSSFIIYSGAISSALLQQNLQIEISSANFIDVANPFVSDDEYDYFIGTELSVGVDNGVLNNDRDYESTILTAIVETEPLYGSLDLELDGSFTYNLFEIIPDGFDGSDSFTYAAIDGSGNQSIATVNLGLGEITVIGGISTNNSNDLTYAKVGDTVRVDIVSNAPIRFIQARIGGNLATYIPIDDFNHSFEYTMTDSDVDGYKGYTFEYEDMLGNSFDPYAPEDYILFDKTKPIIILEGDLYQELELNDVYDETVGFFDELDEELEIAIEGAINSNVTGLYERRYYTVDRAGNVSDIITRTVRIKDSVSDYYQQLWQDLKEKNINTNLDQVNSSNAINFSGLYFEKVIDSLPAARITFNQVLNLDEEILNQFIVGIDERLQFSSFGEFFLDFKDMDGEFILLNSDSFLELFNLNKIGVSSAYLASDVYRRVISTDLDDFELDNGSTLVYQGQLMATNGMTYKVDILKFAKFEIDNNAPFISVSKIEYEDFESGLLIDGRVDGSAVSLIATINNQIINLSQTGGVWTLKLIGNPLKAGINQILITATDKVGNRSFYNMSIVLTSKRVIIKNNTALINNTGLVQGVTDIDTKNDPDNSIDNISDEKNENSEEDIVKNVDEKNESDNGVDFALSFSFILMIVFIWWIFGSHHRK